MKNNCLFVLKNVTGMVVNKKKKKRVYKTCKIDEHFGFFSVAYEAYMEDEDVIFKTSF